MTKAVQAIYEHGMLRLTAPVELAEGQRVDLIIVSADAPGSERHPAQVIAQIAALPMEPGGKEFSVEDHDRILYGPKED
jgi:predicted DNA-binding antitoxin AbrB/MazE fold protein